MRSAYNIPQPTVAAPYRSIANYPDCMGAERRRSHYPVQGSINRSAAAVPVPSYAQPSGYVHEYWRRRQQNARGAKTL